MKPSETRDFVKAFLKVREEVRGEKGNLIYGLSKTLTDNLTFYAYAGAHIVLCMSASSSVWQSCWPNLPAQHIAAKLHCIPLLL